MSAPDLHPRNDGLMDKRHSFEITEANRRSVFTQMWNTVPNGWFIQCVPPTRTAKQNKKLWPMLSDIAKHVQWYGTYLTEDDWKNLLTASLKKALIVPGIDGGFVTVGLSTSSMSKAFFSDLIESMYAFGTEKGVVWSEKSLSIYDEWEIERAKNRPAKLPADL